MTVLDLSQYDLATFDPACFKAHGITGVILATFPEGSMRVAAQQCIDAGLPVLGFYAFVYFGSPFGRARDTQAAIRLAQEFGLKRVWLDCETDGAAIPFNDARVPTIAQRIAEIHEAVALVEAAGLEPGIYTGAWWWTSGAGNTAEFSHLPLWNSYYDQDPDPDGLPYGGWTTPAVEQYSSTIELCGRVRDHNYAYEQLEDDMSQEDIDLLHNLARRVLAGSEQVGADEDPLEAARRRAGEWADKQSMLQDQAELQAAPIVSVETQTSAVADHEHVDGVSGPVKR